MTIERLTAEGRLVEANWRAAWASLRDVPTNPPTLVDDEANFLRVYTPGSPDSLLNLVMGYTTPNEVSRDDIEAVIVPYRRERLPMQWWLMRGGEPQGLREQLVTLGMESWGGATAMALSFADWRAPQTPTPTHVTLHHVENDEARRAALNVICQVFYTPAQPMARWTTENPRFTLYLAAQNGRAVAAMATFIHAGVAGVYHVATLANARRRGVAGALLAQALREAQATGATHATLTATAEARHLYERMGFAACGVLEQWAPSHQLSFSLIHGRAPTLAESPYWEG